MLVLVDDVGMDRIPGYFGNEEIAAGVHMPNLHDLLTKGVIFTDAHSSPMCSPSRYNVLYGRHIFRSRRANGMYFLTMQGLARDYQKSIATVLEGANYHTAFFGKWGIGGGYPGGKQYNTECIDGRVLTCPTYDWTLPAREMATDNGFNHTYHTAGDILTCPFAWLRDDILEMESDDDEVVYWEPGVYDMQYGESVVKRQACEGDPVWDTSGYDMIVVNETLDFLDVHLESRPDDPFFAYVSLSSMHAPFTPPDFYIDGTPISGTYERDDQDLQMLMDLVIGSLVDGLTSRELIHNTIFIFVSDNGSDHVTYGDPSTYIANGPYRGKKGEVWEGGHRVPMIIRFDAGFPAGVERSHMVSLTDLFATICDLANVPLEDQAIDSVSFADYIKTNDTTGLREFLPVWQFSRTMLQSESLRWHNLKFIRDYKEEVSYLFDLNTDVSESHDLSQLSDEYREIADFMGRKVAELREYFEWPNDD